MLTIKCAGCQAKIFKYQKFGKGRVLYCWDARIVKDYSCRENDQVKCACGAVVGTKINKGVKMKQNAFIISGTRTKR